MEEDDGRRMINFIQRLQICVCLNIIRETPVHMNPEDFAKSLQDVVKSLCPPENAHQKRGIACREGNAPQPSKSLSLKLAKIGVKSHEKLMPQNKISPAASTECAQTALGQSSSSSGLSALPLPPRISLISLNELKTRPSVDPETLAAQSKAPSHHQKVYPCAPRVGKARPFVLQAPPKRRHELGQSSRFPSEFKILDSQQEMHFASQRVDQQPSVQLARHVKEFSYQFESLDLENSSSFLEEFGYEAYFMTCNKKIETFDFILTDFMQSVQLTLQEKRFINEETIEELLKVIRLSQESNLEATLLLCNQFYANVLKVLNRVYLESNSKFENLRIAFKILGKIPLLHWRHLETCGESVTQFLHHLLELNGQGFVVDDIGFCVVDLLSRIVSAMKEIIEKQATFDKEDSSNLIAVALNAITKEEFKSSHEEELISKSACLKGSLWRWKWILQERFRASHLSVLFYMQIESLIQEMDLNQGI